MKLEYRYKTNFFYRLAPMFMIFAVTIVFVLAAISFIRQEAYNYLLIYGVIYIFFTYVFRYFFVVYYLNRPVLILTEDFLIFHSPIGIKTIAFTNIIKLDDKKALGIRYLLVHSSTNSPLSIRLNRLDENELTVKQQITDLFNESRNN